MPTSMSSARVLGVPQQPRRDQVVVDDDVGAPHALQAVHGDEARIAGTGADQVNGRFHHRCVVSHAAHRGIQDSSPRPPGAVRRLPSPSSSARSDGPDTSARAARDPSGDTTMALIVSVSPRHRGQRPDRHLTTTSQSRYYSPFGHERGHCRLVADSPQHVEHRRVVRPRLDGHGALSGGGHDTARRARASRSGPRGPTGAGRPPPAPVRRSRRPGRACAAACPRSRASGRKTAPRDGPRQLRHAPHAAGADPWATVRALSPRRPRTARRLRRGSTSASTGFSRGSVARQRQPGGKRRRHVLAAVHGDVHRRLPAGPPRFP